MYLLDRLILDSLTRFIRISISLCPKNLYNNVFRKCDKKHYWKKKIVDYTGFFNVMF